MNLRLRQLRITGLLSSAFSDMVRTDIIIKRDVGVIKKFMSKDYYFRDVDGMGMIFEYHIAKIPEDYIETITPSATRDRFNQFYKKWKATYEKEKLEILFTEDFMPIRKEIAALVTMLLDSGDENILLAYECKGDNMYLDRMIKSMVNDEFTMVDTAICGTRYILEIAKKG